MLNFFLFAVSFILYLFFAGWLRKHASTGQMVMVLNGAVLSLIGLVQIDFGSQFIRITGEVALVFLLFSHTLLMDLRRLRGQARRRLTLRILVLP